MRALWADIGHPLGFEFRYYILADDYFLVGFEFETGHLLRIQYNDGGDLHRIEYRNLGWWHIRERDMTLCEAYRFMRTAFLVRRGIKLRCEIGLEQFK